MVEPVSQSKRSKGYRRKYTSEIYWRRIPYIDVSSSNGRNLHANKLHKHGRMETPTIKWSGLINELFQVYKYL